MDGSNDGALAGSADGLGRRHATQNLTCVGDALKADLASALVKEPIGLFRAAGQQPKLHSSICLGGNPYRFGGWFSLHVLSIPSG